MEDILNKTVSDPRSNDQINPVAELLQISRAENIYPVAELLPITGAENIYPVAELLLPVSGAETNPVV